MGAVQVYAAEQLAASGLPAEVHGTSVGALTAAMRAAEKLPTLRAIWEHEVGGWWSFQRPSCTPWRGLFRLAPLRRLIVAHLHPADLRTECYAHVVDWQTEQADRIALHDLGTAAALAEALVASCSQAGIHEIVQFGGRWLGDGGARYTVPLPSGWATDLVAVACAPLARPWRDNPLAPPEVGLLRGLEVLAGHPARASMRRLQDRARQGACVTLVEPAMRPGNPWDASPATTRARLDVVGPSAWRHRRRL